MIDGLVYKVIRKKPPWCLVGMPGGVRGRGCEAPAYLIFRTFDKMNFILWELQYEIRYKKEAI